MHEKDLGHRGKLASYLFVSSILLKTKIMTTDNSKLTVLKIIL